MHPEARHRTVSSYVSQMSLVRQCPVHIGGAYRSTDSVVSIIRAEEEESEAQA